MTKRIIIVDDDLQFCRLIQGSFVDVLGYRADYTDNANIMYEMIREAEANDDPYDVATIDMDFEIQGSGLTFAQGNQILAYLKRNFTYIMCIMVSGATIDATQILKMRDEQGLDFFVNKRTLKPIDFKQHIQHVLEHRSNDKQQPPRTANDAKNARSVFISYRRENTWGKARAIANSLENHGYKVFLDVDSIGGGAFPKYITEAIYSSEYFMPLLSPGTLESEWVQKEIQYALDMEKTIIPVLLDNFEFSPDTIPEEFSRLLDFNGIIITPKSYKGDIDRLVTQYLQG